MMRRSLIFASLCLLIAHAANADEARKNWYNDPFFQVRGSLPACPMPRGPLMTEAEMKAQSHNRIERGTSCWIAGQCKQSNAYFYDTGIAEGVRQRFAQSENYADASLWVSVRGRFVWVQGCGAQPIDAAAVEDLVKGVPNVERVFVNVMTGTSGKPPYPLANQK